MRSIARCVLPVLVGPSTAVTPRPRCAGGIGVMETDIFGVPDYLKRVLYHIATVLVAFDAFGNEAEHAPNESRPNR